MNKQSYIEECVLGSITLRCNDLCSMLVVDKFRWGFSKEDEHICYNISIQDSSYYSGINSIGSRLKRAWKCLFGKPIHFNDIYIEDTNRMTRFKNDLDELINAGCTERVLSNYK